MEVSCCTFVPLSSTLSKGMLPYTYVSIAMYLIIMSSATNVQRTGTYGEPGSFAHNKQGGSEALLFTVLVQVVGFVAVAVVSTMMSSSDNDLFREMKVLARRYGVAKCQKALDAARTEEVLLQAPKVVTTRSRKGRDQPVITINPTFRVESSLASLLKLTLFSSSNNAKMNLTLHHDAPPNAVAPLLTVLEAYYDSIVVQQQQQQPQQPFDPLPLSTTVRRVESRFHTLYLYANQQIGRAHV